MQTPRVSPALKDASTTRPAELPHRPTLSRPGRARLSPAERPRFSAHPNAEAAAPSTRDMQAPAATRAPSEAPRTDASRQRAFFHRGRRSSRLSRAASALTKQTGQFVSRAMQQHAYSSLAKPERRSNLAVIVALDVRQPHQLPL